MKYFAQEKYYTCGVACFKMMMNHFDEDNYTEEVLEKLLSTNERYGTHPNAIVSLGIAFGYDVLFKQNSSIDEIDKLTKDGYVVMLAISVDVPHWVIYLSNNNNHCYFNDPYFGENIAKELKKFVNDKQKYPFYRWKIKAEEFKDYDFSEVECNKLFVAFKK